MHSAALAHWLRLLWGRLPPPQLAPADAAPFIASGHIHLPPAQHWHAQRAAAAHAAAHLVYSPAGFDGEGLVPIARTLLATLEDARVEALAMRELPGLARLWRPLHTATPDSGEGFEPLLQRLARALIDPGYDDPHAWVRKGRRLFFLSQSDEGLGMLALRTPAELRAAALVLGRDIGQARLPFNHRGYRPQPAYRDDHRWMWPAERQENVAPPPVPQPSNAGTATPPPEAPSEALARTRHPEWDRLIHRLRHDWVTVLEQPVAAASAGTDAHEPAANAAQALARRLQPALRRLSDTGRARVLAHEGEVLDLDALVAWQMARRSLGKGGRQVDTRVYRARQRQPARPAAWLLLDQSASSADHSQAASSRLIDVAASATAATAAALQSMHVACAISGFSSRGRHDVRLHTVQGLHQLPLAGSALIAQLRSLRCGGSTRLGAALRHAVQQLARWRSGPRWVLLLSDAQAHDIDVHDPLYLPADARQAVRAAARRGVRTACLALSAGDAAPAMAQARRIFGPGGVQPLPAAAGLPVALRRLIG